MPKKLIIRNITYTHDPEAQKIWIDFWVNKFIREANVTYLVNKEE